MVIFYSNKVIEILTETKYILVYGTFNIAPTGFLQFLIIHSYHFGKSFPCVYVLLKNKMEICYTKVFEFLKNSINSNSLLIISDFELGIINSVKKVFRFSEINGSLFHFGQSLLKKFKSLI